MKKIFVLSSIIILIINANAQIAPNTYVLTFKDKNNCGYSVENPSEFLSQKTLEKRAKFGIPVTEQDLPVTKQYVDNLKNMGFKILNVSKWLNLAVVYSEDSTLTEKASKLDFITENYTPKTYKTITKPRSVNSKEETETPENMIKDVKNLLNNNKTAVQNNTKSELNYGKAKTQNEMININYLHNKNYTGKGITIAVLDAGFYHADRLPAFDSIFSNKQIVAVKDFVKKDDEVYNDASHGMQVLSTIAANIPGQMIGTAPHAKFVLLRTEDENSEYLIEEYNWIAGAEFADSIGADIIHTSLGYSDFDNDLKSHKYSDLNGDFAPITIAADIASAKGILVVTSAGNEGNDPWHYISAPADADSILAVGAVDGSRSLSYFSSRGPSSDGRIKPEVLAQGSYTTVQGNSGTITFSFGTSFSAPIMAGAAACLWQANPEFNNMKIIEAIIKSADRNSKPDNDYGNGIPDFETADKYLKKLSQEKNK